MEPLPMQLVEAVEFIVVILLYFLFLAVMSLAILLAATGGMALLGAAVATPLLYVLPDVRRFLLVASGGRPDDDAPPWRVAVRPRSVLLTVGFGLGYGVAFLLLYAPVREYGLVHAAVGPIPVLVGIPTAFVLFAAALAFVVHRDSSAWTAQTSAGSVLVQWVVFLTAVVGFGTAIPLLAVGFGRGVPSFAPSAAVLTAATGAVGAGR